MRTRRWWDRALSGLLALWLAVVMAEPAALHACPTHGAHRGMSGGASAAAHGGAPGAAHHADASHGAEHGAPESSAAGHQCSCLGECGAAGPLAAPVPPRHPVLWVPVAVAREASAPRALARPLAAPDVVLPFANGPPARA